MPVTDSRQRFNREVFLFEQHALFPVARPHVRTQRATEGMGRSLWDCYEDESVLKGDNHAAACCSAMSKTSKIK